MIKMLTASTLEIDEIDVAVAEIHGQLRLADEALARSVGILTCHAEFVESGVVRALCDSLPFDVIGCTTLGNSTGGSAEALQLGLAVITSDELTFSTVIDGPVSGDTYEAIASRAYEKAAAGLAGRPSLVIAMLPLLLNLGAEIVAQALYRAVDGVPVFGTISCDDTEAFAQVRTILNGEAVSDALALLLIEGPINPRFIVTAVSDDHIQKQRAVVTDAEDFVLKRVNDSAPMAYMESLGMLRGGRLETLRTIPLIIDHNDGSKPVARAIMDLTPDGHFVCCGLVPVDATLAIGAVDTPEVLRTARGALDQILAAEDAHGVLMFSCVARNYVLTADFLAEMETIRDGLSGTLPYLMAYSGGELCPSYRDGGATVNQFHNFTLTACVL